MWILLDKFMQQLNQSTKNWHWKQSWKNPHNFGSGNLPLNDIGWWYKLTNITKSQVKMNQNYVIFWTSWYLVGKILGPESLYMALV